MSVIGVIMVMVMLVLMLVLVMRVEPIWPVMIVLDPFPGFMGRHPPQRILRVYRIFGRGPLQRFPFCGRCIGGV
jgi:hypothetical protein